MEDWNMLAADCVVISCCCQCLILQIIIFILLKLPQKLVRKTKEYAKKKLWHRKKEEKITESIRGRFQDEFMKFHEESIRIQVEELHGGHGCGNCMEEVEWVLEELSQKGEFAFGSFWGREGSSSSAISVTKQEFDSSVAQFELVEIVGPSKYSD